MNINELTIGQAKELAAMLGGASDAPQSSNIGKKCIIRGYASGVHFGTVAAHHGRQVELTNSRRLWRWDAKDHGISLSEVANHGGTSGRQKFCEVVQSITILDAIEIIPCSSEAITNIEAESVFVP